MDRRISEGRETMKDAKHKEEEVSSSAELEKAGNCLQTLFLEIFKHNGFGSLDVGMRFLKRGQKEILIRCGREYRFVVDYPLENNKQTKEVGCCLLYCFRP